MQSAPPPPTVYQTTFIPTGGQGAEGARSTSDTYKSKMERTREDPLVLDFTTVLKLLEDDRSYTTKDQIALFVSIPSGERTEILYFVKETRHIRVLWVSKNPPM